MKYLRHGVGALIIVAILSALCVSIYNGMEQVYEIEKNYVDDDGFDIMEDLNNLNIISGINATMDGVYNIKNPTGNIIDTLGALASTGIGVAKITTGLMTFPFEIVTIVSKFYHIPPILGIGFIVLLIVYVGYILISAYLRGDL
jgi:hypothetical protein